MEKRADNSKDEVLVKLKDGTSMLSSSDSRIDFFKQEYSLTGMRAAINKLSELENSGQLREDAISNGRAIIKNWHPPTSQEIDKIVADMKKRLLA